MCPGLDRIPSKPDTNAGLCREGCSGRVFLSLKYEPHGSETKQDMLQKLGVQVTISSVAYFVSGSKWLQLVLPVFVCMCVYFVLERFCWLLPQLPDEVSSAG